MREHVAFLQNIAAKHQSTLGMCISSRPLPAMAAQLGSHPNLVLQNHTSTDISRFVEDKLRSAHVNMDADINWLRDEIIEKANGVFLWVHLVLEEIFEGYEEGDKVSELRDRLSAIPSGLDQLFMCIWRMIDKRHTQEAIAMLNALVCAIRPLTLPEFRHALALSSTASIPSLRQLTLSEDLVRNDVEMTKRIRSRCGGLVEISNNIVQFIHQSVKDWIEIMDVTNASEPDRRVDQIGNHQPLLQACLRYLLLSETMELRGLAVRTQPFNSYATYYWLDHYRKAEEDGSSQAEQLEVFLSPDKPYFRNWNRMYHILKRIARGTEQLSLHRMAVPIYLSFPLSLEGRNDPWASYDDNDDDDNYWTPVSFAAEHNLLNFLTSCLTHGTNVNLPGGEYGWPLQAAVVAKNIAIVRLLLDHGADIDALGGRFGTAIAAAITLKRAEIIALLRGRGADVERCPPQRTRVPCGCTRHGRMSRLNCAWG